MKLLNIISLQDAKNYLRIDDDLYEDDRAIERMIKSAFHYISDWTNYEFEVREKTYKMVDGRKRVYDYPINAVIEPTQNLRHHCVTLYTEYISTETVPECCASDLILNVGFLNKDDIPTDIIEVAYELIDLYYYCHKKGEPNAKTLSLLSKDILNRHKRFVL